MADENDYKHVVYVPFEETEDYWPTVLIYAPMSETAGRVYATHFRVGGGRPSYHEKLIGHMEKDTFWALVGYILTTIKRETNDPYNAAKDAIESLKMPADTTNQGSERIYGK